VVDVNETSGVVRFAVFANFKGTDTLLIWGDRVGLGRCQALLHTLASDASRAAVLNQQLWALAVGRTKLQLARCQSGCMMKVRHAEGGASIAWHCAAEIFAEHADKIGALISSSNRGHQYLDMRGDPLQVLVSVDEYPPDLKP
jgi:hypothetical protein